MEILISDSINSEFAITQEEGIKLFKIIKSIPPTELTISFIGISRISSAFLNESIGKYAQSHPEEMIKVKFIYPEGNDFFNYKVNDVIENALLGDEYSNYVDNALAAL